VIKYHNTGKIQQIGFSKRGNRVKNRMAYPQEWIFWLEGVLLGTKIYEKEFPFKKFTQLKINMQQLTNAEEQVMEHLWKLEKPSWKTCLKPIQNQNATTTIATLLKEWSTSNLAYEFGTLGNIILWSRKPIISRNTSTDWLVISLIRRHNCIFLYHRNQFVSNGIGRSQEIIDSEILKKKMSDFLIKSTITLLVLLAVYYLFFGKEKNTRFQ
jgi:hypothetical protein